MPQHSRTILVILALFNSLVSKAEIGEVSAPTISFELEGLPDKKDIGKFLDNLKSETLPKFEAMHLCVQRSKLITETYKTLKSYSFGQDRKGNILAIDADLTRSTTYPYDYSLVRNFASLKISQELAIRALEEFHLGLKLSDRAPLAEISARLTSLEAKTATLANEIASSAIREDAFLNLIENSDVMLKRILASTKEDFAYILGDKCKDVSISAVAVFIGDDLQRTLDGTEDMKSFIDTARKRRRAFFDYLYQYHRYKLTAAYAAATRLELTNLQETIFSVLATGKLVEEFNLWWQGVMKRGLADSLHTKYFQYEEPLRRLYATRETAQSFLERVEAYSDAPDSMKVKVQDQIRNTLRIIDRNIKGLESKGWLGQFEQQKLTIEAMYQIRERYLEACIPALEEYRRFSGTVIAKGAFYLAEQRYAVAVDSCLDRKEP